MVLKHPHDRQIILGSPVATLSSASNVDLTITCNEPGTLHLDTLCISAGQITAARSMQASLTDYIAATSALVFGSIELIRGRNSVVAPAGAFSPYRSLNQIRLGDWPVQAGDTFAVNIASTIANSTAAECTMSAAFSPSTRRGGVAEPGGASTYAGSPTSEGLATSTGNAVTLTFDEAGVFALGSLNVMASSDHTAAGTEGYWTDAASWCQITDIALPSGNKILVGNNTPTMSPASFSAGLRAFSWAALGAIPVSASDTIVITWDNPGATDVNLSFGGRFSPRQQLTPSRC